MVFLMPLQVAAGTHKPQWTSGRLLVQARVGVDDADLDDVLLEHGARRLGALEKIRVHVVSVPPHAEEAIASVLAKHPKIAFAEPDALIPPDDTLPNDPHFASQWHLPLMKAPAAWDFALGDGVIVAVLDTGVDGTHPALAGKLVPGWNIYDNNPDTSDVYGHGTNVAGVIGAAANNALGVASLAWNARIMPVRISQPVAVDVAASDNVGVERVELYANGQLVAEASEAPYAFSLNALNFDDGFLTLTAKAWDQAGNSCTSANVTVTVDNVPDPVDQTPPQVKILSPTDGSNVSNKVTISISATDDVKVASLKCSIDGVLKASTTGSALKCTWFARKAAAGAHTIQAVAADTSGNTGTANVQVQVIKTFGFR